MKDKQLNKEEQLFKDKLNELHYEFDPADWKALEKQLPKGGSSSWMGTKGIVTAIAAAVVVSAGVYYFNTKDQSENPKAQIEESAAVPSVPVEEEKTNLASEKKIELSNEQATDIATEKAEVKKSLESIDHELADSEPKNTNEKLIENDPISSNESSSIASIEVEEEKQDLGTSYEFIGIQIPSSVCPESAFQANLKGKGDFPANWSAIWSMGDFEKMTSKGTDQIELRPNGSAMIKVQILNEDGNVFASDQKEINVSAVDASRLDFTYEDLKDPYNDLQLRFESKSDEFTDFQWKLEDGKLLKGQKATYVFKDKGVYDLALQARTNEGCLVEISKPVAVELDFDPLVPNAFTPDQNGVNDSFIAEAFRNRDDRFKMEIFSLSGELIFRTLDKNEGWNGHFNNSGSLMPEGIYVWKIIISNEQDQKRSFAGNVRILRP